MHEPGRGRWRGRARRRWLRPWQRRRDAGFCRAAGADVERTGDKATLRIYGRMFPGHLNWMDMYGDRDADEFVECDRRSDDGLVN